MPLTYKRCWHIQRQGAWRTLVDKVKAAKKRGSLTTPVQELNFATYYLLALMKLRNYGAAVDELAALGDLDAPHYSYDEYPSVYPGKSGLISFCKIYWVGCHSCAPCRLYSFADIEDRVVQDLLGYHYIKAVHNTCFAGSMVPFALRWMRAELPHRTGQTATTMERLYALFAFCSSRVCILYSILQCFVAAFYSQLLFDGCSV